MIQMNAESHDLLRIIPKFHRIEMRTEFRTYEISHPSIRLVITALLEFTIPSPRSTTLRPTYCLWHVSVKSKMHHASCVKWYTVNIWALAHLTFHPQFILLFINSVLVDGMPFMSARAGGTSTHPVAILFYRRRHAIPCYQSHSNLHAIIMIDVFPQSLFPQIRLAAKQEATLLFSIFIVQYRINQIVLWLMVFNQLCDSVSMSV